MKQLNKRGDKLKDYRNYTRPYSPEEWEADRDWLAKRLEFLWTYSEYYTSDYLDKGFAEEKNTMYELHNEVIRPAQILNREQYKEECHYKTFKGKDRYELKEAFKELSDIRKYNKDAFLRKRIYIKYYFLRLYLYENE